ncbi:MAG TPA: dienelactone hydrolase family protein [Vicinamibacteria bacterium]|nr:dienelactone hydrolase family protein [Vicinamibacteria bacterium]
MTLPWDDEPAPRQDEDYELSIQGVALAPDGEGEYHLVLRTSRGDIPGQFTVCEGGTGAALLVSGAAGGLDGPADGIYVRIAEALRGRRVSTLRLHYRQPGEFDECLLDVLGALSFLKGIGAERVVIVGHSFGGAVAIRAGVLSPIVSGVAAMSSQLHGAREVAELSPRPLLLVHGMDDQVLEATASETIYAWAEEPKRLVLYAGAGHSLVQCQAELYDLLTDWIPAQALPPDDAP